MADPSWESLVETESVRLSVGQKVGLGAAAWKDIGGNVSRHTIRQITVGADESLSEVIVGAGAVGQASILVDHGPDEAWWGTQAVVEVLR